MENLYFGQPLIALFGMATSTGIPLLIVAIFIRRQLQKRRYYARDEATEPIEGTLDDLTAVDPLASPWTNDERRKLMDTMELVGRFHTLDGYSDYYVEDLMALLRKNGIACNSVFQETLPMGVAAAIVSRVGTYEIFAERTRIDQALRVVEEFRDR